MLEILVRDTEYETHSAHQFFINKLNNPLVAVITHRPLKMVNVYQFK